MKWLSRLLLMLIACVLMVGVGSVGMGTLRSDVGFIAYTLIDDRYAPHIMLIDPITGMTVEITHGTDTGYLRGRAPNWSSDGQRFTFRSFIGRGDPTVQVYDMQQHRLTNITEQYDTLALPQYHADEWLYTVRVGAGSSPLMLMTDDVPQQIGEFAISNGRWSPDGTQIAYVGILDPESDEALSATETDDSERQYIYLYDRRTGETRNITRNLRDEFSVGIPQWSPDGTQIAFRANTFAAGRMFVLTVDDERILDVDARYRTLYPPRWSPDGQSLLFSSSNDIFMLDVATQTVTQLTDGRSYNIQPSWSPDGKQVAFISGRYGQDDIFVVDVATQVIRRLTHTSHYEADPMWQP